MARHLPAQADDPKAQQNFEEIEVHMDSTDQAVANANLTAQIATKLSESQPAVSAFNSTSQSIPNGTDTTLNFDSENFDVGNLHDNAVNNSRLTASTNGLYLAVLTCDYSATAAATLAAGIFKNGTTTRLGLAAADVEAAQVVVVTVLSAGDFLIGRTAHITGSPQPCVATFAMARLSKGS